MIEVSAKTEQEAIEEGLKILNKKIDEVRIEIVQKSNIFKKSIIKMEEIVKKEPKKLEKTNQNDVKNDNLTKNNNKEQLISKSTFGSELTLEEQKIEKKDEKNAKIFKDNSQKAIEFLENLFKVANIEAQISLNETEKAQIIEILSPDSKFLIGPHAETMNALQILVNNFVSAGSKLSKKLLIDVDCYRQKKREVIVEKTKKAIEKCLQTAKPVSLDFMNAYERFIVHEIVMENGKVISESFGKEPRRFVKIFIK